MAKAELEQESEQYSAVIRLAKSAEAEGDYARAVEIAASAWAHVEGMMQYRRKYEDVEFRSVPCIDLVLKYAPLIFDAAALESLAVLLKKRRAIDRHASDDLAARVESAKSLMQAARRLWDHIENNGSFLQRHLRETLGGEQEEWRWIAERWERMDLIVRESSGGSYCLRHRTNLSDNATGRCCECGHKDTGEKIAFFAERPCHGCGQLSIFVMV